MKYLFSFQVHRDRPLRRVGARDDLASAAESRIDAATRSAYRRSAVRKIPRKALIRLIPRPGFLTPEVRHRERSEAIQGPQAPCAPWIAASPLCGPSRRRARLAADFSGAESMCPKPAAVLRAMSRPEKPPQAIEKVDSAPGNKDTKPVDLWILLSSPRGASDKTIHKA